MKKICMFLLAINFLYANDIMTENYPPFNYKENGKLVGITSEIVDEIKKNINDTREIKLMPWARAYKSIQNKPNKILFSMTRTKQREFMFKWVGPVSDNSWVFYAKADSNIVINTLDDAKNPIYKIGTYYQGANELFLRDNDFDNLYSVPRDQLNVQKLIRGRINLWAAGETQGIYKAKQLGINPNEIKKIYKIKDTKLYIAFSRTTPNSIINQWQEELDKMKKDGRYQKIMNKYLK
ncbi:MAG TPA: ABC transporter substrate-binding protein [Arcobacter sp.]|nr:ABC transporter substrate-binding protein [Arcobacter sp.]